MAFIEPCFGIGHNLSLICQMTSEDIKHQLIINKRYPALLNGPRGVCQVSDELVLLVTRLDLQTLSIHSTVTKTLMMYTTTSGIVGLRAREVSLLPSLRWSRGWWETDGSSCLDRHLAATFLPHCISVSLVHMWRMPALPVPSPLTPLTPSLDTVV